MIKSIQDNLRKVYLDGDLYCVWIRFCGENKPILFKFNSLTEIQGFLFGIQVMQEKVMKIIHPKMKSLGNW